MTGMSFCFFVYSVNVTHNRCMNFTARLKLTQRFIVMKKESAKLLKTLVRFRWRHAESVKLRLHDL
jgi:hypothetical protein